jgi:hypothetical protein
MLVSFARTFVDLDVSLLQEQIWRRTLKALQILAALIQNFFSPVFLNILDIYSRFLIIKPTRCTNFSNYFGNETLHVSDSSSVHHQELSTVHSAAVYVIQVCRQLSSSSRIRMELQFSTDPAARICGQNVSSNTFRITDLVVHEATTGLARSISYSATHNLPTSHAPRHHIKCTVCSTRSYLFVIIPSMSYVSPLSLVATDSPTHCSYLIAIMHWG